METEGRLNALESLNPLFTLRYSATHKKPLPQGLQSESRAGIQFEAGKANRSLAGIGGKRCERRICGAAEVKQAAKGSLKADLNIHYQDKKETKKKKVSVKYGDDLFEKSGGNEAYRHGFIIDGMDFENQELAFSSGKTITRGGDGDAVRDEIMKTKSAKR